MNLDQPLVLRPITAEDMELLYHVYASTRTEELAQVDWSDAQKATFLHMQFEAQHRYYQEQYAGASFDILLLNGEPIGRLYVARWPDQIRIMDIALAPGWRNRGIGTTLLEALLAEGQQSALPVTIHVEQFNPARHLYERLGFHRVSDVGVYSLMRWEAGNVGTLER